MKVSTAGGGALEDRRDSTVGEALEELSFERGMIRKSDYTQVRERNSKGPLASFPLSMAHHHARAEEAQALQSCRIELRKGDFSCASLQIPRKLWTKDEDGSEMINTAVAARCRSPGA